MIHKIPPHRFLALIAALTAVLAMQSAAPAQKDSAPKPVDNLALGADDVKQLLLLIGADKNGKITKHEWMSFMEAEFDRLDAKRTGELDAKELAESKLRVSPFAKVGK